MRGEHATVEPYSRIVPVLYGTINGEIPGNQKRIGGSGERKTRGVEILQHGRRSNRGQIRPWVGSPILVDSPGDSAAISDGRFPPKAAGDVFPIGRPDLLRRVSHVVPGLGTLAFRQTTESGRPALLQRRVDAPAHAAAALDDGAGAAHGVLMHFESSSPTPTKELAFFIANQHALVAGTPARCS